jgi:uncharacterized membrane protein YkoI
VWLRRLGPCAVIGLFWLDAATEIASAKNAKEMAALQQAKVTLHEAIGVAQREVPGSWVVDADIATVKGKVSYSIEVVKDGLHAVRVDLENGRVLNIVKRRIPPKDWKQMAAVEAAEINMFDAIAIAEGKFPGGKVVSADVKTRSGRVRWDINIEQDGLHVVHVDPESGSVLKVARKLDD